MVLDANRLSKRVEFVPHRRRLGSRLRERLRGFHLRLLASLERGERDFSLRGEFRGGFALAHEVKLLLRAVPFLLELVRAEQRVIGFFHRLLGETLCARELGFRLRGRLPRFREFLLPLLLRLGDFALALFIRLSDRLRGGALRLRGVLHRLSELRLGVRELGFCRRGRLSRLGELLFPLLLRFHGLGFASG